MVYNLPQSSSGAAKNTQPLRRPIADKYHTSISGSPIWPNSRMRGGPEPSLEEVMVKRREDALLNPGARLAQTTRPKKSSSLNTLPPESHVRATTAPFDRPRATRARLRMLKTASVGAMSRSSALPHINRPLTGLSPPSTGKKSARLSRSSNSWEPDLAGAHRTFREESELVAYLTEKCNSLASKLQAVEQEMEVLKRRLSRHEGNVVEHLSGATERPFEDGKPLGKKGLITVEEEVERAAMVAAEGGGESWQTTRPEVNRAIQDLSSTVDQLRHVFTDADQLVSDRLQAAITIQTIGRMYIVHRRYQYFMQSMRQWKTVNSNEVCSILAVELERQKQLEEVMAVMRTSRTMRISGEVFSSWAALALQTRIKHRLAMQEANKMIRRGRRVLLGTVFQSWWSITIGPLSTKFVRSRNADRRVQARKRLEEKYLKITGSKDKVIVLNDEVRVEMNREAVELISDLRRRNKIMVTFNALRENLKMSQRNELEAKAHFRWVKLSAIFFGWSHWVYLHSEGLDRKRWHGPGGFVVGYNQREVDLFARRRLLKIVAIPWFNRGRRSLKATMMMHRIKTRLVKIVFFMWRKRSNYQHRLRKEAVTLWKQYADRQMGVPFRMWFLYAERRRKKKADRARLLAAHDRMRTRRMLWKMMRAWRHQAVYGRLEGMYTRRELVRSLAEQKELCESLQQQVHDSLKSIDEMSQLMANEKERVAKFEEMIKARDIEIDKYKMAIHHAEQDVIRLQSLIDAAQQINPRVTNAILELQPNFNFRERGLTDLAQAVLIQKKDAEAKKTSEGLDSDDESGPSGPPPLVPQDSLQSVGDGESVKPPPNAYMHDEEGAFYRKSDPETENFLIRADFVLERTDYREWADWAQSGGKRGLSRGTSMDEGLNLAPTYEELVQEVLKLHRLFEFFRSGEDSILPYDLKYAWGIIYRERRDAVSFTWASIQQKKADFVKVNRQWSELTSHATVNGLPFTWNDFKLYLTAKAPKLRKTETLEESMERRIVASKERRDHTIQTLYINDGNPPSDVRTNIYGHQKFTDDMDPGTPRRWSIGGEDADDFDAIRNVESLDPTMSVMSADKGSTVTFAESKGSVAFNLEKESIDYSEGMSK